MISNDIFQYITKEETNYKQPIDLMGWQWCMPNHIKTGFYYKHGRLLTGNQDDKPVKNIVRPILKLLYRTEDIDVKDVFLYIDNQDKQHLSFLIKKYHDDVFVKEYDLDTLWDDFNMERIDYGGGLLKNINQPVPELVPLSSLAFCDQTDMLSGPIGIKHFFSPDQLLEMADMGWGKTSNGATISLEELIVLSTEEKDTMDGTRKNVTPGKYIEVYEVHGNMPNKFLKEDDDSGKYTTQMQIVAFYTKKDGSAGEKEGVILFKGKEDKSPFKLSLRNKINGRALGFGAVEELEESQVWTNYNQIRFKQLLDSAAKTLFQTDDQAFANRNKISSMENNEITVTEEGKTVRQIDTFPRNAGLFERYTQEWEQQARTTASANEPLMGESPSSGTPFALQELVVNEGKGEHDFNRGQFAKDVEKIYRDWIIPHIITKITQGKKFLSELSIDEMEEVGRKVIENQINKRRKEQVLNGEIPNPEDDEIFKATQKEKFMGDNKKFIEILKGEFEGIASTIGINILGKQKKMAAQVDKLVNIFRQVASAPQLLDDPRMAKLFNQILESSGLSPINFGAWRIQEQQPQAPVPAGATAPIAEQSKTINNK